MPKALLIANKKHLSSKIPGGVQICTSEFISLFENAGFELIHFPIQSTKRVIDRIKIKLGIDAYNVYDYNPYIKDIIKKINNEQIGYIIINQVNLFRFARKLKEKFGGKIKIICWSHGNESGDFLHSLVKESQSGFKKFLRTLKLGRLIYLESFYFSKYIDYMFTVSETEKHINQWLGSNQTLFVPRLFSPKYIKDRNPIPGKFGFVGTLNHPPNRLGLEILCREINKLEANIELRVVGTPSKIGLQFQDKYAFIKYVGYLDDEQLINEMKTWSFFLNPVFWYSRGVTTKLALAINSGIPVISTPAGNRGYFWNDGKLITVSNPKEMAIAMIQYADKSHIYEKDVHKIANNGPQIVQLAEDIRLFILNDRC